MKKILALAVLAGALSSCVVSVGVTTPPSISNVALASRYVSGGNSNEYYICGNQDETVSVSVAYSGDFSSFKIDLVGQLNDGNNGTTRAFLPYGPFTLDTSVNGEGDTLSVVTRRLLIKKTDIKPNSATTVQPQAVTVTPVIITAPSNEIGIGGIFAEVTMTNSFGSVVKKSSAVIRLLSDTSSRCK